MQSKGIGWVESIYQTIETVCEDVDSAINQAPMKYVGNPVHTVGKGVKKFCSSVMQDLLLPVNSGNDDLREASQEESDYVEGFIDSRNMEENEFYMNGKQPVEAYGAADGENKGIVNSVQSSSPVEKQESNVKENDSHCNSFDTGMHAVGTQGAQSQMNVSCHSANTELISSLMIEKSHSDPDHEFEHIETPTDGSDRSSSPDVLFQRNVSYHSAITESTPSLWVEKPHSDPYHEYEHIETPCDGSGESSTFESAKAEFTLSTNISENALPNSTKPQSMTVLDNITHVIVSDPVGKSEQNFGLSMVSESETLSCSPGSLAERGWGCSSLESSMMFSDICISDDLSDSDPLAEGFSVDDIKSIQPDLFISRHPHFASSHRRPSLKSYKKLLQDTLNSKRRLVKEYKQLGILHGDIYEEPGSTTSTKSSSQPATPSTSTKVTTCSQNLSEWELL